MLFQERRFSLLLLVLATLLLLLVPSTTANATGAPQVRQVKNIQEAMESCKDPANAAISLYMYPNAENQDVFYSCKEQQEKASRFGRAKSCDYDKDKNYRWPAPFTKVVNGQKFPGIYYQCDRYDRTHMFYCKKQRAGNQIRKCSTLDTV